MSKRKLLLADDSVTIQKVVNLTFADEGIEVISVGDGDTALDKFVEVSPDLVMADVNMPGLTGYQLCERIRQEASRQIPVILLVGSFEPFDEEEARRVGADDYLTKPFQSIRQLVNKVTVLLNSSPEAETAKLPEPTPQITSFDDTLEMEKSEPIEVAPTSEYSDTGYDDEMIEANSASSFAFDESQKFETKPAVEPEYDYAATQPLTNDEIKDFDLVNSVASEQDEPETIAETSEEFTADEPETVENTDETVTETVSEDSAEEPETDEPVLEESPAIQADDEIPMPEVADVLQLDEANPLELPPIESDGETVAESEEVSNLVSVPAPATTAATASNSEISTDLIDAIVQKVMERLSEKAVKEIAWEVVPEVTERVVKKMAEENLKK